MRTSIASETLNRDHAILEIRCVVRECSKGRVVKRVSSIRSEY